MKTIFLLAIVFGQLLPTGAQAYVFEGPKWPDGYVWFWIQLNVTENRLDGRLPRFPLWDGSWSFDASFRNAMWDWSYFLQKIQFVGITCDFRAGNPGDGHDNVMFNDTIGGDSLGGETLAVTDLFIYTNSNTFAEADITFSTAWWWNSYRGPLLHNGSIPFIDFRRVALHEIGHALGLDHPDDHGQHVAAIMNSTISNTDDLTSDDLLGGWALYGRRFH